MLRSLLAFFFLSLPSQCADCEALSGLKIADTTITVAKSVAAGAFTLPDARTGGANPFAGLPAFCQVHGVIKPSPSSAINFEVWLPMAGWNGRLQTVGNGGLAGTISYAAMATALKAGFVTTSTDTGHTTTEPKDWLRNKDRLIDYSYRGLHLTTVNAKAILSPTMGKPRRRLTTPAAPRAANRVSWKRSGIPPISTASSPATLLISGLIK